jgi:hypothetical protein
MSSKTKEDIEYKKIRIICRFQYWKNQIKGFSHVPRIPGEMLISKPNEILELEKGLAIDVEYGNKATFNIDDEIPIQYFEREDAKTFFPENSSLRKTYNFDNILVPAVHINNDFYSMESHVLRIDELYHLAESIVTVKGKRVIASDMKTTFNEAKANGKIIKLNGKYFIDDSSTPVKDKIKEDDPIDNINIFPGSQNDLAISAYSGLDKGGSSVKRQANVKHILKTFTHYTEGNKISKLHKKTFMGAVYKFGPEDKPKKCRYNLKTGEIAYVNG